jgi:hypothetical protein
VFGGDGEGPSIGEILFWTTGGLVVFAGFVKPSPHLSWDELTTTSRLSQLKGGNKPDTLEHRFNLLLLANLLLERVRSLCGGNAMTITSGYRSSELQHLLYKDGTSSTDASDHEIGAAADLYIPGFGTHEQIATVIYENRATLPVRQCIIERHTGHLHLAIDIAHAFDPAGAKHDYRETFTGKSGDYPTWRPR